MGTEIDNLLDKVIPLDDAQADRDVMVLEGLKSGTRVIEKAVAAAKDAILKQAPEHEQGVFSFLPTELSRTSPFFPMSRKDMKVRTLPPGGLVWENSWGRMTIKGEKLSIYDETVLLACLSLMRKYRSEGFDTTRHELCKEMGVTPAKDTYRAVWGALGRLSGANIGLEIFKPGAKKKKTVKRMTNTILAGAYEDDETGKLNVTINPYFLRMYAENLVTNINLEFRAKLKGDISKALYRFFRSQRGMTYECHLLTLCRAINLDVTMPLHRLRTNIRAGFSELKKSGYLKKTMLMKSDIVKVWKKPKGGACIINGTKR
jgi:Replication initiator protein A